MSIKKSSWFDNELKKLNKDNDSLTYKHILDFSENVLDLLSKKGIKNKNKFLSQKLNCSPAYITKLFNGRSNFTIHKLVEIASALDYDLNISIRPKLTVIKPAQVFTASFLSSSQNNALSAFNGIEGFTVNTAFNTIHLEKETEVLSA